MAHYNDNYDNRGNRRFEEQYGTNSSQRHEEWNQGDQNVRNRGQVHQGMQGRYEHEGHNNPSGEYRGRYDYESTPDYRQHSGQHGQWGGGVRQETGATSGNQGYSNQPQGGQIYGNQQYGNQGYGQQSSGSGHGSYNNQGYSSQSQVSGHSYGNPQHGNQGYGQQSSGSGHGSYNNQGYSSQPQGSSQSYGNQQYGNQGYGQQSSGSGARGNQQWLGNQSYGNPSTSNSERENMNRPGNSSFEGATGYGNTDSGQIPTYTGTAGSTMGHTSGNQWGGNEGSSGQWARDQGNYGSRQELGAGYNQEYNRGRYGSQAGNTFGEGPYRGRGPKGFHRSDERIKEEVCERLSEHGYLDASDIEVEVQEGEVILKGTVQSRQDKRTAEDVAESLSGVADVQNQLRVQRENGSEKNSQSNSSQKTSVQSSSSQNASPSGSKQQTQSGGNGSSQTQQATSSSTDDASAKSTKK